MVTTRSKHKNEPLDSMMIGGADRAREAPETAKDDDAWHDFIDFANKFVCLGWCLKARKILKLIENDSDIHQSGCTALPTCCRHVVNGTHCVGVSVLTNRLRERHARGGHWTGSGKSYVLVCTSTYQYILVHVSTGITYQYILVRTCTYFE
jgi:hypothetical protein